MSQLEPHEYKEIVNVLERASTAALQLLRIKEITHEQYESLNQAIWNIESKIKGDE